MLTDRLTTIALASACTANSGNTAKVGNEIDLLVARDIGNGKNTHMMIQVDTTLVGSGASFELKIVSSAVTALTTPTVHWTSGVLGVAVGVAGMRWQPILPIGDYLRYLGLTISVTGANITAGKLDAFLQTDDYKWSAFREGIS